MRSRIQHSNTLAHQTSSQFLCPEPLEQSAWGYESSCKCWCFWTQPPGFILEYVCSYFLLIGILCDIVLFPHTSLHCFLCFSLVCEIFLSTMSLLLCVILKMFSLLFSFVLTYQCMDRYEKWHTNTIWSRAIVVRLKLSKTVKTERNSKVCNKYENDFYFLLLKMHCFLLRDL